MTTGREHAARLTEMAVRAQEAAEWVASQDATDAMYEKYKADVQDLRRAVQERTTDRDEVADVIYDETDAAIRGHEITSDLQWPDAQAAADALLSRYHLIRKGADQ